MTAWHLAVLNTLLFYAVWSSVTEQRTVTMVADLHHVCVGTAGKVVDE